MNDDGAIVFSTNFKRFKLADECFDIASITDITKETIPLDFKDRRSHRCWRIRSKVITTKSSEQSQRDSGEHK